MKYYKETSKLLLFIFLLSIFTNCDSSIKETQEKIELVDIDGDGLEDFVGSQYGAKACHTIVVNLSSEEEFIYTPYDISLGYTWLSRTKEDSIRDQEHKDRMIRIKDFDGDGKSEVFAEIFTCCYGGQGCWDHIPEYLEEQGITSHFIILEYEDGELKTWAMPLSTSPEQYFYSKKVNSNQDLIPKKQNGKYGYVDKNDKWIILPELDHGYSFFGGIAPAEWQGIPVFINKKGEITNHFSILSGISVDAVWFESQGFDEKGWILIGGYESYFLDTLGNTVKDKYFCSAYVFSEELALVSEDYKGECKYGYINRNFDWVIPPKFDTGGSFKNGKTVVKYQNKDWYLYKDGTLKEEK